MILAIDSYYFENKAKTVCLIFEQWNSLEIKNSFTEITSNIENYVPGEFYKREHRKDKAGKTGSIKREI